MKNRSGSPASRRDLLQTGAGLALGSWLWGHVAQEVSVEAGLIASTVGVLASLVLYRRAGGEVLESPRPPAAE